MVSSSAQAVAARQDGLITRRQAIEAATTDNAIRHALQRGWWQRVLPGVYATFNGGLAELHRLRAAVLYVGRGAAITGAWACWTDGLRYAPEPGPVIDVLVPPHVQCRTDGFVRVVRSKRPATVVNWHSSEAARRASATGTEQGAARSATIPVVHTARAVVDTVGRLGLLPVGWQPTCQDRDGCRQCLEGEPHEVVALRNVRALMCEVIQRRRTTLARLSDELALAPRQGTALARRAMADILAGCRSAPECELRDIVLRSRVLPEPLWNKRLPDSPYRIRPDACWPERRLVVEVDSRSFHGFGDAPEETEERRALYATLGWRVLPVSPARIRREPRHVQREIEEAYRAGP